MSIMQKARFVLALGLLTTGVAACGDDDAPSGQPSTESTDADPGTDAADGTTSPTMGEPAPVDGETSFAELVAAYDGYGTDAGPGEFPRTVRHMAGETTLEARPERIVTLDSGQRDALMALGITPVGIADGSNDPEALADVPRVGVIGEPNFEAIAALEPDLILTTENRTAGMYELLAAIAPTVSGVQGGPVWKQDFDLTIAALGAEEEAADLLERYEARAAEIADLAAEAGPPEVSLIRLRPDDIRIYLRRSYAGIVLDDAGLLRPEAHNLDANHETISFEQLDRIDADVVLVAADKEVTPEQLESLRSAPLWSTLEAAQRDQIVDVDSATWIAGGGYFAALSMLDDLEQILRSYEPR